MRREFNVLALIKDDERYVYVYDDESRETLLRLVPRAGRRREPER